jgi:hypothetical protein
MSKNPVILCVIIHRENRLETQTWHQMMKTTQIISFESCRLFWDMQIGTTKAFVGGEIGFVMIYKSF